MAVVALWAYAHGVVFDDRGDQYALPGLVIAIVVGLGLGGVLRLVSPLAGLVQLGRREALLLVALSWIGGAGLAAVPYWLWAQFDPDVSEAHQFNSFMSCYFEAMSGLTTTGATVLGGSAGLGIGDLPKGLLLWRALTHWLGGVGIVVLFVAVLPTLGVGGKRLVQVEAPGPQKTGVRPRIGEAARVLWLIYLGMTVLSILALRVGGVNWFDSVCHTFAMVSTGGLSTQDASIGAYNSVFIDLICMFFMVAAGVNFALYLRLIQRKFRSIWRDGELWVYLGLKIVVVLIITGNLLAVGKPIMTTAGNVVDPTVGQALRYSGFQTIALHTGTGFSTSNYDLWPFLSRALLVGLMFVGGCAGSTAGGIKVIRFWIALKVFAALLSKAFRPSVVRPLRVGDSVIDQSQRLAAVSYFLLILLLFGLGTMVLMLVESGQVQCDFQTAMSAALSTLCNVGPGLYEVGSTKNYGWFSDGGKAVLSLLMCLGRLELYAILVLFLPSFWRSD